MTSNYFGVTPRLTDLMDYVVKNSEILGIALITQQGLLISKNYPGMKNPQGVAAMVATMAHAAFQASKDLGDREITRLTIDFKDTKMICLFCEFETIIAFSIPQEVGMEKLNSFLDPLISAILEEIEQL